MSFLFFILLIIALVIGLILSAGLSFLKLLFRNPQQTNRQKRHRSNYNQNKTSDENHAPHKKVFKKNEGEYIDYEEVE